MKVMTEKARKSKATARNKKSNARVVFENKVNPVDNNSTSCNNSNSTKLRLSVTTAERMNQQTRTGGRES